jgi:hypothetical protein
LCIAIALTAVHANSTGGPWPCRPWGLFSELFKINTGIGCDRESLTLKQAMQIQSDYAKRVYDNHMAELSKLGEMYVAWCATPLSQSNRLLQGSIRDPLAR